MQKSSKRIKGKKDNRQASGKSGREKRFGSRQSGRKAFTEVTGTVQMTRDGFVFVVVKDEPDSDVFVKASKTRGALNGDTVRCVVTKEKDEQQGKRGAKGRERVPSRQSRSREGEIVEILQRSTTPFVGILHTVGRQAWVLMQSRNMPYDIELDMAEVPEGARKGMKVAAVIDGWERKAPAPHGHIVDVLGMPGENETEMHAILSEYGLPYRFDPEVENAAAAIDSEITGNDLKGRKGHPYLHHRPLRREGLRRRPFLPETAGRQLRGRCPHRRRDLVREAGIGPGQGSPVAGNKRLSRGQDRTHASRKAFQQPLLTPPP